MRSRIRRKWRYRLKSWYSTKDAGTVTARHISRRKSGMSIKGMDWKRSIRQRLSDLMQRVQTWVLYGTVVRRKAE